MNTLWQDLRYGARMIWKKPGFSLIAALAIALGIGAVTTIFSAADATMVRPFSFPNQERLMMLFERKPEAGITRASVSPGNVIALREQFADVAGSGRHAQSRLHIDRRWAA